MRDPCRWSSSDFIRRFNLFVCHVYPTQAHNYKIHSDYEMNKFLVKQQDVIFVKL